MELDTAHDERGVPDAHDHTLFTARRDAQCRWQPCWISGPTVVEAGLERRGDTREERIHGVGWKAGNADAVHHLLLVEQGPPADLHDALHAEADPQDGMRGHEPCE